MKQPPIVQLEPDGPEDTTTATATTAGSKKTDTMNGNGKHQSTENGGNQWKLAGVCQQNGSDPPSARPNASFHHFRYVIIALGGMMMGSMLFLRLSITVAMISMVNKTAIYLREHPNATAADLDDYFPPDYVETGEFEWNNEIQQLIMTGYMVAYTLPQLFTTRWSMRYGIRISLPISLAICALSNLLTPSISYWGWQWCLALRLFNAFGASAILPSMVNAIEAWMPHGDSGKGLTVFQFVANLGMTAAPIVSGFLTSYHWQWAFYIPGTIGLFICLVWWFVAADNPAASRFISQRELDLINGVPADGDLAKQDPASRKAEQRTDLPWYFMFKISSFYSLTAAWILYCATMGGFLFLLPNYLNRILQVPVEEVGVLNFTVQIGSMFCMLLPVPTTSLLQRKFHMSVRASRALFIVASMAIVIATHTYLAVSHDNLVLVIAINRFFHMTNDTVIISTVMSQFGRSGLTGLVYSMINTVGNLSTVFFCWAVGRFLDHTGETLECWSYVLYTMVAMHVVYVLTYVIFCHSDQVEVEMPPRGPAAAAAKGGKRTIEDGR